ncbi:hypothetical protein ILUMI_24693 [Ignelater luminosus]|uniref:Peptidase S1 domain-containing protein n=1 Tax=Ignelater luminosus TaxID=2038154 RepID=A0A8K0FWH6_IGNLU|nr:hypothetical protein ILUMI_24693 [Ignelater luminosus]
MKLILMQIILAVTSSVTTCYKIKQTNSDRIVNGLNATLGQFPFMVSLSVVDSETVNHLCGGSIITRYWSLTAAHCIDTVTEILIKFDYIKLLGNNHIVKNSTQHDIDCYKIHSQFTKTAGANDITLIKVKQPFDGAYEKIIIRPPTNFKYVTDSIVTVVGWGDLSFRGAQSEVLKYVELRLVDDDSCRRMFDYFDSNSSITPDAVVCAGTRAKSACQGDSGGPLIQRLKHLYQIGIVSWGTACGEFPGVYARVTTYLGWIKKIMKQHNSNCPSKCITSHRNT